MPDELQARIFNAVRETRYCAGEHDLGGAHLLLIKLALLEARIRSRRSPLIPKPELLAILDAPDGD